MRRAGQSVASRRGRSRWTSIAILLVLLLLGLSLRVAPLAAEPLAREAVPEPLSPWIDWVLRGHEDQACPFLHGDGTRACVWPGRLSLALEGRGGRFRQELFVARASDVPLPGSGAAWPEEVRVAGVRAAVIDVGGTPHLRLSAGSHSVEGRFVWPQLPPGLSVPGAIGLVELELEGRRIASPRRDADGSLWLREGELEPSVSPAENRVTVEIARRFSDAVPPRLTTLVTLRISGEAREEQLGIALPEGWLATALSSPLPARLDADGRLRVQLRPGDWTLQLEARQAKPSLRLAQPKQPEGAVWDESEVWSVAFAPELRLLELSGAPTIDPTQAEIPGDWHGLPTHRLDAQTPLVLVEKRRGNEGSPGDQLSLDRTWYLDFDGDGATVVDRLQGQLRRSLRVEMEAGTTLGRVAVAGIDQPITHRGEGDRLGVETSLGQLALEADSRVEAGPGALAAVGWAHDVDQLTGTLWIPPGYRLLHAGGVDTATTTWVSRWDLLAVFFVLLTTVVAGRLFGALGAGLALATLVLVWNEPGAPALVWLVLAVAEALRRAVGHGRFARIVQGVQGVTAVVLILIAVPFAVAQLRGGLFPALALPGVQVGWGGGGVRDARDQIQPANQAGGGEADGALMAPSVVAESESIDSAVEFADAIAEKRGRIGDYSSAPPPRQSNRYDADPSAVVPTGPGRPDWSWEAVSLAWSGPVTRDHVLSLWLIPPFANGLLAVLRVALVAGLFLLFARGWRDEARRAPGLGPLGTRPGALVGMVLVAVLGASPLLLAPLPARAEMPTPELLEELRNRLLEQPTCVPHCAQIPLLTLDVTPDRLRIELSVEVGQETGLPLPGGSAAEASWLPARVEVDGRAVSALRRDASGVVWVRLTPGVHGVVLEGPIPGFEVVSLPLPLVPRRVALARAPSGFRVVGIGADGRAVGALQLVREAGAAPVAGSDKPREGELAPTTILPFALVTRQLELGLRGRIATRIERIAPADGPIVVEIPLLPGESLTTPDLRVENGRVRMTLAAGQAVASYEANFEIGPTLVLTAPADAPWSEVWQLSASPIWHVEAEGIPPVDRLHEGARLREWRPWPGEKLALTIERPRSLEAATLTLDRALLSLVPGARASDATLTLSLRSSQGGQHVVTLPEGAELTALSVGGAEQPLRQEGRAVTIALAPGSREAVLGWREPRGIAALFRSSEILLGADAVNASIEVRVPENRWLLAARGPRLGPTVLFWSTLLVVAGLAVAVARTGLTPLGLRDALLLGVGLTQAPIVSGALVAVWFLGLGMRGRESARLGRAPLWGYRIVQLAFLGLTLAAAAALIHAIGNGLLGTPEMRVAGNGSSSDLLRWYVDRTGPALAQPLVVSLSLWWYRAVMLAWSMWLAFALVDWARWGFAQWSRGGLFRPDAEEVNAA